MLAHLERVIVIDEIEEHMPFTSIRMIPTRPMDRARNRGIWELYLRRPSETLMHDDGENLFLLFHFALIRLTLGP